ncbi:aldehyde dehydrogenase family protein [Amycolatopsis acidiphila]|uniref:Aldehyde dehydrogenase family protein n=1 Tax=Amycolatopsis acidiphila TaxID=715473 RepID=A0A558AL34_9PSEU|nr:aldehyde dehydrogenase family protein [Amycolatopsis acidiphila]TVT24964.1 aldehyde dehydrogenase family protein [Amycolatopsis acidiphila]UIJ57533.1 aldehyde dehydrogenase family protein [Amycolatopsis acidiphila]GHG89325.1 aldehyde dehydrogenase [Amycolatopsis acidiphila]
MTLSVTAPPAVSLRHLVAGRWCEPAGAELLDTNPARPAEIVARGTLAGEEELDAAVRGAVEAFPSWAATPFPVRGEVLARTAAVLDLHAGAWGEELAREEGKTRAEGVGEVRRAAEIFRFYASEGSRPVGEVYASPRPGEQIQLMHRPVGPVAVITPFNFPIAIPAWKIAPALAYGNTVVWKPASTVPLLAMRLAEALVGAGLPAGVLSLLIGEGALGARLAEHPGISRVTFTGSTAIGRRLIERCGTLSRPVQTEMGGKNAAAVLGDANLELAVDQVLAGAFRATGQKCTATSRVIVTDAIADEFLELLTERVAALTVGDPVDAAVEMGPLVSREARDGVLAAVTEATHRPGVRVLTGGTTYTGARAEGAFLAPTVIELAGDDELWRDELFGPVLTVRRAGSDREALDLVNDSVFGLAAAVFTDNLRAVTTAMEILDVGVLHINSETAGADPHVPFGGSKESGFGPKEQGRAAREFFTTTKTVYLKSSGPLTP